MIDFSIVFLSKSFKEHEKKWLRIRIFSIVLSPYQSDVLYPEINLLENNNSGVDSSEINNSQQFKIKHLIEVNDHF